MASRSRRAGEMGEVGRWAGLVPPLADGTREMPRWGAAPGPYRMRCDAVAERYRNSPRERDVFDLLVRGRSIDYIAQNLTISFNTAKSHSPYLRESPSTRQEPSTSSTASARCWALGACD